MNKMKEFCSQFSPDRHRAHRQQSTASLLIEKSKDEATVVMDYRPPYRSLST